MTIWPINMNRKIDMCGSSSPESDQVTPLLLIDEAAGSAPTGGIIISLIIFRFCYKRSPGDILPIKKSIKALGRIVTRIS